MSVKDFLFYGTFLRSPIFLCSLFLHMKLIQLLPRKYIPRSHQLLPPAQRIGFSGDVWEITK